MATGFLTAEYQTRVAQVQARMAEAGRAALLLTTEADVRYLTGFLTRFWESPTRPWFLVVPAIGDPIAVIPSIGADLMQRTWVTDIRCWRAPDYTDDGVSCLADALTETVPPGAVIGVPSGNGTHLRMPLGDWERLLAMLPDRRFEHDAGIMSAQRLVKSNAEIDKIAAACGVANRAFDRVPEIVQDGIPLCDVFRRFQILCLEEGADWVPYLAGGAGPGGYRDVISPATDVPVGRGDVMMLDTGLMRDGYFCDFDRNFAIGPADQEVQSAHARLIEACHAAFDIARPGRTVSELFHVMDAIVSRGSGGAEAGRLGHGVGMQLTEPPSLIPDDHTVLTPGMVLTLEPAIATGSGRVLVHEENIVVREGAPQWLSAPAGPHIREVL